MRPDRHDFGMNWRETYTMIYCSCGWIGGAVYSKNAKIIRAKWLKHCEEVDHV